MVNTNRTLTINGTANQVISSLAGAQSLAADRTWTLSLPQNIHTAATPTFGRLTLNAAGSTTISQLTLSGTTNNWIGFNQNGVAAPAFTTRSAGTKIVLYPNIGASSADFALGIEGSTLWSSVGTTSHQFKWYGGTTQAMLLSGGGNLTLAGATHTFTNTSQVLFEHSSNNTEVPFNLRKGGSTLSDDGTYGTLYLSRANTNVGATAAGSNLYFVLRDSGGAYREYAGIGGRKTEAGNAGGALHFYRIGRTELGFWNASGLTLSEASTTISFASATGAKTISTGGSTDLALSPGGNVRVKTAGLTGGGALQVGGDVRASGEVFAFSSSDKQLKDNITLISNPIEKIMKIGGYTFDWNDKQTFNSGKDYGVIAQEIEEIMPELVNVNHNGFKAVRYEKITPLLIEAIKEQNSMIKNQKERIDKLEEVIQQILNK
jgi:hypothetical protein